MNVVTTAKKADSYFIEESSHASKVHLFPPSAIPKDFENNDNDSQQQQQLIRSQTGIRIALYNLNYKIKEEEIIPINAKEVVDYFLQNDIELLGIYQHDLTFDDFIYISSPATSIWTTVRYVQGYNGIPVYGTDFAITVNNQQHILQMILGNYMNGVYLTNMNPILTSDEIFNIISQEYGESIELHTLELIIYQAYKQSLLAWKVALSVNDTKTFEVIYSDKDGAKLHQRSLQIHEVDTAAEDTTRIIINSDPIDSQLEPVITTTPSDMSNNSTDVMIESVKAQTGYPISLYNFNYQISSKEGLDGNPKAIADYFLEYDINLMGVRGASVDSFHFKSIRTTSIWTTVRYLQVYENIPVYGTELAITVNEKNIITIILGTYMNGVRLNRVEPNLSTEEVNDLAIWTYNSEENNEIIIEILSSELVIFQAQKQSLLAWKVNLIIKGGELHSRSLEVLFSDETKSILQEKEMNINHDSGRGPSKGMSTSKVTTNNNKGGNLRQ